MAESDIKNTIPDHVRSGLVSALRFEVDKLDYSRLKADRNNQSAQSGKTMYLDIKRMHTTLVINGKKMIDDSNSAEEKESLIDKAIEEVDESTSLLYKLDYGNENYRHYLEEVFEKIFLYSGARIPDEPIIQELITNCNQAGYEAALCTPNLFLALQKFGLTATGFDRVIHINCCDQDSATLKIDMETPLYIQHEDGKVGEKIGFLPASLEFKLRSRGNEVKYTDGRLLLTLPKELEQDKNLSSMVKDFLIEVMRHIKAFLGIEELEVKILYESKKPQTRMESVTIERLQVHQVERWISTC